MYGYVYIVTDLRNDKKYVGQKKGDFNSNYFGSGKIIKRFVKKYGKENFKVELINYTFCTSSLNKQERLWIKKYDCIWPKGYNLADGGHNGDTLTHHPNFAGIRIKMSKAAKKNKLGKLNPFYGKKHSESTRIKMRLARSKYPSSAMKGRHHTRKTIVKIKLAMKLHPGQGMTGKHHTEESNLKNRIAHLNRYDGCNNPFYGRKHKQSSILKATTTRKMKGVLHG